MKQFVKSIFAILTGNILLRLLGVVFTPLLVRVLTKPEYGTFAAVLAVFHIVTALSKVGLFGAVTKYTADSEDETKASVLVGGVALSLGYAIIVAMLVGFSMVFLPIPVFQQSVFFVTLALAVLVKNPFEVFRAYLYGEQNEGASQKINVVRKTLYVVLALGLAWAGFGVPGVFYGFVLAYGAGTLLACWHVSRTVSIQWADVTGARERLRDIATYGGINTFGSVAALLLYKTDILIVSHYHGQAVAGEYQAALFPAELIWFVPGAIQAALLQETAKKWADRRIDAINRSLENGLKYGVLALTLFGIGLFALAETFLTFYYGPQYATSALALRILLVGTFFYGVNRIAGPVLQATGRLKHQQATNVLALVLNLTLNLLLVPRYGIEGAAVATALSYVSVFFGSLLIFRFTELRMMRRRLVGSLTLLVVSFGTLYVGLVSALDFQPLTELLVFPIVGAVLFGVLSHALSLVTPEEIRGVLRD